MWNVKSNKIALALVWLAYFAFMAHTFDFGCLHRVCLHTRAAVASCESEPRFGDYAASSTDVEHFCESDCELRYDSPDLVKLASLIFSWFVIWIVVFSDVRLWFVAFRGFRVPLGRNVFLLYESLLI